MTLPQLESVLTYRNAAVIKQYCREHPGVSAEQAQQIFLDLLGLLWLSEQRRQRHLISPMIKPLEHLDHMWHVFILHTRFYTEFCQLHFNRYLHHEVDNDDVAPALSTEALSAYLNDSFDLLGEDWVLRNFNNVLNP